MLQSQGFTGAQAVGCARCN